MGNSNKEMSLIFDAMSNGFAKHINQKISEGVVIHKTVFPNAKRLPVLKVSMIENREDVDNG